MNARRLGLGISLLLVLGAAAAARAQPAPRIPLKDFFDNPKISSAAISPDGRQLAFLAPEGNRMNVWVGDVARSLDSARAITHDTQRGIMHFAWTRDSRYVLFEQDRDGDENFHLFRADPLHADAKAVDLTPVAGARAEVIDLPRGRPGEAIVAINGRDKRYFDAYRLDLETGELQLIEENPGDVDAWHVDSHGDIRACTAQVGTKTEIRARDSASGSFRTLATYTDEESPNVHGFSADGTYLYFSSARDANAERLVKLDLKTGKETLMDADPDYDLSEVTHQRSHQAAPRRRLQ